MRTVREGSAQIEGGQPIQREARMSEKPEISEREYDFQVALFSVSSALVGVCLTAIGLILVAERMSEYRTISDALLVFDALIFLAATLFSYLAMRSQTALRFKRFRRMADVLMFLGLLLMISGCVVLVFTLL